MGRKSIPTALKLIRGTDQPCRINPAEPKAKSDKVKCPTHLTNDAKKFWRKFVPELQGMGIIGNSDVPALEGLCEKYAEWQEYQGKVRTLGAIVKHPTSGAPIPSPYFALAHKSFEQFARMLSEFGMTPASRTKVSTLKGDSAKDEWADL